MVTQLQIIPIKSLERAILYQTYTRDYIVVVQQERKMRHQKSSHLNNLDPGSRGFDEVSLKNLLMLPNYLLDEIGILIWSRKQVYESCCVTELYTAPERTDIQDPTCLDRSPRKKLFDYDCQSFPFYENQEGFIRDLAERDFYWNIDSIESPNSTEKKRWGPADAQNPNETGYFFNHSTIAAAHVFCFFFQQSKSHCTNLSNCDATYQCLACAEKTQTAF